MHLRPFFELLWKKDLIDNSRDYRQEIPFIIPLVLNFKKRKPFKVDSTISIINLRYTPCDKYLFNEYVLDIVFHYKISEINAVYQLHIDKHYHSHSVNHPLFHLHFGGKRYKEFLKQVTNNNIIHFVEPRIPHYPMDIVLCIDFLLANFSPHIRKIIENDSIYKRTLINSQQKYLWPYYDKIQNAKDNVEFRCLLPNIIISK